MIHRASSAGPSACLNRWGGRGVSVCMNGWGPVLLALVVAGCGGQGPVPASDAGTPTEAEASAPAPSAPPFAADPERLRDHLEALQAIADEHEGMRFAGTPGYEASVDYAAGVLRDLGFTVETPTVEFAGFRELPGTVLEVGDERFEGPDELHALIYSPSGEVSGPVAVLERSGCDAGDFAEVEPGSIVLTTGGGCFRRQQALNAAAAEASALLVGYPGRGPGEIYRPTLIDPDGMTIPVVSVTDEAVHALQAAGTAEVWLTVATDREPATLRNVVAQLGDGPRVVMAGGHLDSVLEGPGINDNGSGVAALLELARGAAEAGLPDGTALRIGLWGGEELGTIGSRAYVETLDDEPVAYINLDMAGSPNGANLVYAESGAAAGSEAITAAFEAWFDERGQPFSRVDIGGSSDHFGFVQAGIPTGGLFAGATESGGAAQPSASASGEPADACYHLACDDIDNVDVARIATFSEALFAVAYELAASR